jgi:protein gp37
MVAAFKSEYPAGFIGIRTWCDSTFHPWLGCMRVSPACDHCYAAALNWRTGRRDHHELDFLDKRAAGSHLAGLLAGTTSLE